MSLRVDIRKKYKGFALDAAFTSDDGTLALLGASGSGKSMTLKCIAGLISPDEGLITHDGRTLFDSAAKIDLRPQERSVGYLFQNYALFPNMTVRENITIAYRGKADCAAADVAALLARYGLAELAGRYPVQLSGGQQQRVALARIFACRPRALLLDEPFSALDTFLRENMQAELKRIIRDYSGTVVLVTHSRDEAYKIADRLVILDGGGPVAAGPVREVFARPGNIRAARITGCKNISAIEKTGERRFFAKDWGIELTAAGPVSETHTHAGIRAHDFKPALSAYPAEPGEPAGPARQEAESINAFAIEIADEIDGMFEKDIIFKTAAGAGEIWWIVDRNTDTKDIRALSIAPESILLLEA
ncbi:MAG: ATP-binding cassette domain-containing protein [Clostridiales Family XIII bacterium]|jgi:molybdate transport system ATP-binding protein|nr:ATP-binding cassette domain-containing protein [Clostridiales Family XIII bacterium]